MSTTQHHMSEEYILGSLSSANTSSDKQIGLLMDGLNRIAAFHLSRKEYHRAKLYCDKVINIGATGRALNLPGKSTSYAFLAHTISMLGEEVDCDKLFRHISDNISELKHCDCSLFITLLNNCFNVFLKHGLADEADFCRQQALYMAKIKYGYRSLITLELLLFYGDSYRVFGDQAKAKKCFLKAKLMQNRCFWETCYHDAPVYNLTQTGL